MSQKANEKHCPNSKSFREPSRSPANPPNHAGHAGARSLPMRPVAGFPAAAGLPGSVPAEGYSGVQPCGGRGHPRNQHRHGAGPLETRPPYHRSPWEFRRHGACLVTALANSLLRIWTAKSRVPRLTGRGYSDFESGARTPRRSFLGWLKNECVELTHAARRTAPTAVLIALRIFQ